MEGTVPAGAAGSGSIGPMAGVVLVILLFAALASVGPVREAVVAYARGLMSYFIGPAADGADGEQESSEPRMSDAGAQRASERDSYDFDLSLLALGDPAEQAQQ